MDITGFEANPEEIEAIAEHQEVANEEAAVETVGIGEDRSGDQRTTVGSRKLLKRRTKDHVVQGTTKGHTFRKRRPAQPKSNNGIGTDA
jgi:hypothetical protein